MHQQPATRAGFCQDLSGLLLDLLATALDIFAGSFHCVATCRECRKSKDYRQPDYLLHMNLLLSNDAAGSIT